VPMCNAVQRNLSARSVTYGRCRETACCATVCSDTQNSFAPGCTPTVMQHPRRPSCPSRMLFVHVATGSAGRDLHF
jgi:hypothetical protein